MTAVDDLQRLVERDGYTEADVAALKLLAADGWHAEKAAGIVLTAKRRGADPVQLAEHFMKLSAVMRSGR